MITVRTYVPTYLPACVHNERQKCNLRISGSVHQGDPLGPALLSCAIHRVLLDIQDRHPAMVILAYLDDVLF